MNQEALSPIKRALQAVEKMQAKLAAVESAKHEPIAVIGMGCRFPGGVDNPDALRDLLRQGKDAITEVPGDRWSLEDYYDPDPSVPGKIYSRYGGFLSQIDTFEPQFFGISAREATSLDPQQRLLLEVSWEALENANQSPDRLSNSLSGVFIGICASDYAKQLKTEDLDLIDAHFGTGNTLSVAAGRLSHTLGLTGPSLAVDTACSSSLVAVHLACQHLRHQECDLAIAGGVNLLMSPETSVAFSRARMLAEDGKCKTFDRDASGYVRGEGCGAIVLKRLSSAVADGDRILAVIKGSAVNQNGRSSSLIAPSGPAQQAVMRQALTNSRLDPQQVSYVEVQGTGTALGGDPIELGALAQVYGKHRSPEQPLRVASVKTNIGHLEGAAGIAGAIKVILQIQNQEIYPHLNIQQLNPQIDWQQSALDVPRQTIPWHSEDQPKVAGVSAFGFSGTNAHIIVAEPPTVAPPATDNEGDERPYHILTLSAKTEPALQALVERYLHYLHSQDSWSLPDVCFTANTGRAQHPYCLSAIAASPADLITKLQRFTQQQVVPGLSTGKKADSIPPKIAFVFGKRVDNFAEIEQLYRTQPTFRQGMRECTEIAHALLDRFELNLLSPQTNTETDLAQFAWEYALAKMWQAWGITPTAAIATGVGQYAAACIAGVFNLETGLKLLVAQPTPDVSLSKPQLKLVFVENNHLAGIFNEGINRSCTVIPTLEQAISTLKQQEYTVLLATGTGLASRDDILCIPHSFSGDYWQKLLQSVVKLYFQGVKIDWAGFDRAYQRQPVSLPTYPWQRQRYWWQQRNTPNGNGKGISVEHLSAELASSGELSPEEVQLLPKLLNLIEQKLQPHQETSQDDISPQNQELLATIKQRTLSAEDIKTWLSDRIASDLGIAAAAIDPHAPFDSYGIDSVLAIGIASEGKRLLGFDISPIVLVHYPTIDVLSRYLAEEFDKSETEILEI